MSEAITIKVNQRINATELAEQLSELGYEKIGISTPAKEGQFAARGNLIDLWLERYKTPVRVDLIGEVIENLYLFNSITQSKIKMLKEVYIVPFGTTPKLAPAWTKRAKFPSKGGKYERLFLSEIQVGDLVVHIDHGIGRFLGIVDSEVDLRNIRVQTPLPPERAPSDQVSSGTPRTKLGTSERSIYSQNQPPLSASQCLLVEYAKGDKLYVPVNQIERLTKYIGAPGYKPRLNSLGTASWDRIKAKVQESIVKTASDLLKLYAQREIAKRPPYSPDSAWQRGLEASFEFEDTADQLQAGAEIKKDLEGSKPMDRVLVGDVGFGKTEVAIRAAFKAVQDSRQVAVLVPTTILAEQHYHLFKNRLQEFPVQVEMLSRFRTKGAQTRTLENLKKGNTDIVIGTHRLLSGDVEFKDLGLLIIDEEHRFGVRHKEKLKSLRTNVDVLSMSATPIPRTLHMALTSLRDISILRQPPAGRRPIETFIGGYDDEKIKTAVESEIKRGGQVYYVFNRVAAIAKKAAEVAGLIPNARVVFAHGQMSGPELESVMERFYSGEADVLVCTTIIGSGLDMPNVNTIIIEDVQNFGLAELYQLRGRVGRSERAAYACLFYPKNYAPVGDVLERLIAIGQSKELGAGFTLAKKDLEIRGAGNLLGTA
ncbi:MAG: CarD family transcriptional regulator, partial [bacterium]|nr:CarD family transcriptional regulator [bacterium]